MDGSRYHELAVLDSSGDLKTIWDPKKPAEVEMARKAFNDAVAKGYSIFNADPEGEQGKRMRDFDPSAARMIGVAPIQAG